MGVEGKKYCYRCREFKLLDNFQLEGKYLCDECEETKEERDKEKKRINNRKRAERRKKKMKDDPEYRKKINKNKSERKKQQYNDPNHIYGTKKRLRNLIKKSFVTNGYSKTSKTQNILGISYEGFREHIEKQFTEGMSWGNRHLWHMDHIMPISSATNEEELIKLNHYTNFQPLWAEDNLRKGDKILG